MHLTSTYTTAAVAAPAVPALPLCKLGYELGKGYVSGDRGCRDEAGTAARTLLVTHIDTPTRPRTTKPPIATSCAFISFAVAHIIVDIVTANSCLSGTSHDPYWQPRCCHGCWRLSLPPSLSSPFQTWIVPPGINTPLISHLDLCMHIPRYPLWVTAVLFLDIGKIGTPGMCSLRCAPVRIRV